MAVPGGELLSVVYGLASAASWGAGDFSGAFATRRTPASRVVILSQFIGGSLLFLLALWLGAPVPAGTDLLTGALAGVFGALGLVALYRALAQGRMGVAAPVAAVGSAVLPVLAGVWSEGLPSSRQLAGFGIALVAVWFLTRGNSRDPVRLSELALPVAAGIGFGLFTTLIGKVSASSVLWPLIAARSASALLLTLLALASREGIGTEWNRLPVIALAGMLDTGGNAFFALAASVGRLDIAAVLSSLYPGTTVLLAWLILKERLAPLQWVGVISALVALALIAM